MKILHRTILKFILWYLKKYHKSGLRYGYKVTWWGWSNKLEEELNLKWNKKK